MCVIPAIDQKGYIIIYYHLLSFIIIYYHLFQLFIVDSLNMIDFICFLNNFYTMRYVFDFWLILSYSRQVIVSIS